MKLVDLTETNVELQKTADEVNILRHASLQFEATKKKLHRTTNRFEEYSDMMDQLIREVVADDKAIDKTL